MKANELHVQSLIPKLDVIFFGLYLHLQDQGVAAGGFKRVYQVDYVGVLEPLEQTEFLSHPVPPH